MQQTADTLTRPRLNRKNSIIIFLSAIALVGFFSYFISQNLSLSRSSNLQTEKLEVVFEDKSVIVDIPVEYELTATRKLKEHNDYSSENFKLEAAHIGGFYISRSTTDRPITNTSSEFLLSCKNEFFAEDVTCKRVQENKTLFYCRLELVRKAVAPSPGIAAGGLSRSSSRSITSQGPAAYIARHKEYEDMCFGIFLFQSDKPQRDFALEYIRNINVNEKSDDITTHKYIVSMNEISNTEDPLDIIAISTGETFGGGNLNPNQKLLDESNQHLLCSTQHRGNITNYYYCICRENRLCWLRNSPKIVIEHIFGVFTDPWF